MPLPPFSAHVEYTSAGTTNTFGVTFPYLEQSDISVTLNGTPQPFAWITSTTIQTQNVDGTPFTPASGVTVRIQRTTPIASAKAVYQDGSTLSADDLMQDDLQNLYGLQELQEQVAALQLQINNLVTVAGNLPAVTTGNNGYVLQVVGGVWTLQPTTQITVVVDEQVDGTNRLIQKKTQALTVVGTPPSASGWITIHTGTGC